MLQALREKTSGWIAIAIVAVLAVPFAFFGMEQYLFQNNADYAAKVERVEEEARALVDEPALNLSSPKQLSVVLFDKLELPKTKKTKTGYSTAAGEIEALAEKHPHPFLDHLLAHREYQKMKSTIDGLIEAVGDDGRIHTTFNQKGAATGRLSAGSAGTRPWCAGRSAPAAAVCRSPDTADRRGRRPTAPARSNPAPRRD